MPVISIDNEALRRSSATLDKLRSAKESDVITDEAMRPFTGALSAEFARMRDCEDNVGVATEQIEALEKALSGWKGYREYQTKRLPGLLKRYTLARDYVRAAEDEQTGTP